MDPLSCLFSFSLCFSPETMGGQGIAQASPALQAQSPSATASRPAWQPKKASSVLAQVQAFYDGTRDLKSKFTQTYHNPTFGSTTVTKGTLKLKKPGKMVWDYAGKSDQDIYADGKQLWVVEHDTRQVVRTDVNENSDVSAAMKFLFGGQKLLREFKVRYAKDARAKKYGDAEHHVIELKPKQKNPHYKGLALVVHHITGRVDAFVVYNQNGSTNYFQLSQIKTNNGLGDAVFKFELPKGYVESAE
jgi:outer membrane lipoprotein carrier protein